MYLEICDGKKLQELYDEYNTNEETIRRDVQYLMEWLEKQPHLPNMKDEWFLANFLIQCKNRMELAKKKLDLYFTEKVMCPNVFQHGDEPLNLDDMRIFAVPMPRLTSKGHRIVVQRILKHNPNEIASAENITRVTQAMFDYALKLDRFRAFTMIYDLENFSPSVLTVSVQLLSKYAMKQLKMNPLRYDKLILLNVPSYAFPIINLLQTLTNRSRDKIIVWKEEPSRLAELLPKECLPKEYGGIEKSLEELKELFYTDLQEKRPWSSISKLISESNLSKKQETVKKEDSMYGIDGSFRKLAVD